MQQWKFILKNNLKILFVDDDISLLQSIRRYVRLNNKEWNCMFSNSGEEALKILSQMPFDLIILDMRIPQMDGSQLLRKVKKKILRQYVSFCRGKLDKIPF